MLIRKSMRDDIAGIIAMYPEAFPDEDLVPVVRNLLNDESIALSLVATGEQGIVGNVIFTTCGVEGNDTRAALLGPLAFAPDCQRQGIGSALVRDGLRQLEDAGFDLVCVLGDPNYYGRFGFVPERQVATPYPLPADWADAWQSQYLGEATAAAGTLLVPPPWQHPELWSE